ncbi:MAG TPA: hypothetical protein VE641_19470 [Chthoniobacterales bacterium]|nr:hypothetical protein [Chthoniobacterales bacterium]
MKNPIFINTNSYLRSPFSGLSKKYYVRAALMLPVICLVAFTGCSSFDSTAENQTPMANGVGAYLTQNQEKPNHQVNLRTNEQVTDREPADDGSQYEWFY